MSIRPVSILRYVSVYVMAAYGPVNSNQHKAVTTARVEINDLGYRLSVYIGGKRWPGYDLSDEFTIFTRILRSFCEITI